MVESLDRDGWFVVEHALDAAAVTRLRLAFEGAQREGTQHVRIDDETPEAGSWRALESHQAILAAAAHVLGPSFRVRDVHGRNPLPGWGGQGLHTDHPPRAPGEPFSVLSAIWMLDDFTRENGATRVVSGTHLLTMPIPKPLAQPNAHDAREAIVTGLAGSVLVFNGHLWHSGTRNASRRPRRAAQMLIVATREVIRVESKGQLS